MSLIKWDPFGEFSPNFLKNNFGVPLPTTAWNPLVDIFENDNSIVVKAELPGVDIKDIEVRLENYVLTLKGERRFEKETKEENYHRIEREYGAFSRAFTLPAAVNADKATAEYKDGVLTVTVLKREETKPMPIKIAAA